MKRPVVVLGPMESEIHLIEESLEDKKVFWKGGHKFTEGKIDGYPVVAVRCLIGVVNSASAAVQAIYSYAPNCLILQGTAGAHNVDLHRGDIVLGKNVVETGSFFGVEKGEGKGFKLEDRIYPGAEMALDACKGKLAVSDENIEVERIKVLHSNEKLLDVAKDVPYTEGSVILGTIGAGDQWNKELDVLNFLRKTLDTDCEEMEGFGVLQVCQQENIPALVIRVISNSAFHSAEIFDEKYAECGQRYTLNVIREIIAREGFYKAF